MILLLLPVVALAGERTVKPEAVPPAVVKAATDRYPTAKVTRYIEETEGSTKRYEVVLDIDGQKVELIVATDGTPQEEERVVAAKDLPAEVAKTLAASKHAKATVGRVERVEDLLSKQVRWEVVVEAGGKRRELVFDSSGALKKDMKAGKED